MGLLDWLKGKGDSAPSTAGSAPKAAAPGVQPSSAPALAASAREASRNDQSSPGSFVSADRIIDDFTPLLDAYAQARGGGDTSSKFFEKVFALPELHTIASVQPGESIASLMNSGTPISPLCVREQGQRMMVLFTSQQRAHQAAVNNGLRDADGAVPLLNLAMPASLSTLLNAEVDGLIFNMNRGDHGITMPLGGLAALYEYQRDELPPGGLRAFLRNEAQRPSSWGQVRVARRLIKDGTTLFFCGAPDRPGSPLCYVADENEAMLALFTDHAAISGGASMLQQPEQPPGETGRVTVIPTSAGAALAFGDQLCAHSKGMVMSFVLNVGTASAVVPFAAWRKAITDLSIAMPADA